MKSVGKVFGRILWWGNVRNLSFTERIAFARRNDFDAINIAPADIVSLLDEGWSLEDMRRTAEDAAVGITYLDPVVSWLPDWRPGPDAESFVPFLEAGLGREFEFADGLGIDRMLTIMTFPRGRYEMNELSEHLGRFAEMAQSHGITCVIEAMPFWGLTRFSEVVELMRRTAASNVRLVFDTWHYCRGGREDSVIADLEPGLIDHVQIADGTAEPPSDITLFDDCLLHRLPPGEGGLPLEEILSLLARHGHLNSVGPEVFSAEFDELPGDEIAARLMTAFNRAVETARRSAQAGR